MLPHTHASRSRIKGSDYSIEQLSPNVPARDLIKLQRYYFISYTFKRTLSSQQIYEQSKVDDFILFILFYLA